MFGCLQRKDRSAPFAAGCFQAGIEFEAPFLIDRKQRAAIHLDTPVVDGQDIILLAKLGVEKLIQLLRPPHLHCLRTHHRPGHDRKNQQREDDDFSFRRGLVPDVNQLVLAGGGRQKVNRGVHSVIGKIPCKNVHF